MCVAILFATVDSDFVQYCTASSKRTLIHAAHLSGTHAALLTIEKNPQLLDAAVFRSDSQGLYDDDGHTSLSVFEAARLPTCLTIHQRAAMIEREGAFMDAFEQFQRRVHDTVDVPSWRC